MNFPKNYRPMLLDLYSFDFDDLEFPVMKAVMEEALCSTVAAFQIQENSRNTKY